MNIIVLVKQVPDTTEIRVDKESGTLIRQGVPSIINPDDLAGVEEALRLKDQMGAKVYALTMGPKQSSGMLRELLARGCDEVILVTDPKFAGADTWATSNTIAKALETIEYDLIIAGRQAIDGDTAQVGPQVAEKLNIPQITYVEEIVNLSKDEITVKKSYETRTEVLIGQLPCLITTISGMNKPRYMNCCDLWAAFDYEIKELTTKDLDLDLSTVGLKGSPTKVKKTFNKTIYTENEIHQLSPADATKLIVRTLKEQQFIG